MRKILAAIFIALAGITAAAAPSAAVVTWEE